jgi:hypothetical protein
VFRAACPAHSQRHHHHIAILSFLVARPLRLWAYVVRVRWLSGGGRSGQSDERVITSITASASRTAFHLKCEWTVLELPCQVVAPPGGPVKKAVQLRMVFMSLAALFVFSVQAEGLTAGRSSRTQAPINSFTKSAFRFTTRRGNETIISCCSLARSHAAGTGPNEEQRRNSSMAGTHRKVRRENLTDCER